MKLAPFFAVLILPLILPVAASGKDSAYQALRAIGNQALLSRVMEVKGLNGTPQPEKWTVVLDDPLARGGVREIEIANGHIVSERTPVKSYSGSAEGISMNFQKLNLDSDGAFTVAEETAKRAHIGFDSVDYVLRCDDANSAPTWVLQLLDEHRRAVGTVNIAADNGTVVNKSFGGSRFGATDSTAVSKEGDTHVDSFGHRVDRSIHRAGASVEEFFTGKRTWDQRFEGE
jgi:hypothetical protein